MANITARMTVRKGTSSELPKLLPGEFGQTTDTQRLFIGQALVLGAPATTASTSEVTVEFNSAAGYPIDLDEMDSVNNLAYGITVTDGTANTTADILGANISFVDQHATFTHALARVPLATDLFHLWYNKEVGFDGEAFPNPIQSVTFAHTSGNVNTKTLVSGVDFLAANKNSIIIDYTLKAKPVVTAGNFVVATEYKISTAGSTNFTLIGASANTVGTVFTATGVGTGTGTAQHTSASRHGKLTMLIDSNAAGVPTTHSIKDEYDISVGAIPVAFSLKLDTANKKFSLEFKTDNQTSHEFKYTQKSFK